MFSTARSLVALVLMLLLGANPLCAHRPATEGRHTADASPLATGLSSSTDCARPARAAADPAAPSERHGLACALGCAIACGSLAPIGVGLVEARAAPAIIVADAPLLRRGARRTESFGRSWSSRAPPLSFS